MFNGIKVYFTGNMRAAAFPVLQDAYLCRKDTKEKGRGNYG